MPFSMAWMDLEGIVLNEICQTEKDKYCVILFLCRTKTKQNKKLLISIDNRQQVGGCQTQGVRANEIDEVGQKVQTTSYKVNKFW